MINVSIIVPVYNVEKYIEKCLYSLVSQTLENIEIIVVNDGSTDNSQEIIDLFIKKYPNRIRSFIKENGGQGDARNFGLSKSKGEYILFVDSDDYVDVNMAKSLYKNAIDNNSDIVVCGCDILDEDYNFIKSESAYSFADHKNVQMNLLLGKMAVWNKLYRRSFLVDNNLYFRSKKWYEDLDFTVKCIFSNVNVSFLDKSLYKYIIRNGSTMNNNNVKRNFEITLAFDELIDYFKNKNIDKGYIEFLAFYHIYILSICRVLKTEVKYKQKLLIIKRLKGYLKINFPNCVHNKYIKYINFKEKICFYLIKLDLYYFLILLFKIMEII